MPPIIKPIETVYKGYRFRSRLEARWAFFFDCIDMHWEYELEGFDLGALGYYLPDFWFPDFDCWGEVKFKSFTQKEYNKAASLPQGCLILDGMPTTYKAYWLTKRPDGEIATYSEYNKKSPNLYGHQVVLPISAAKGRWWFLYGEHIDGYWLSDAPENAARAARFEHGETPQAKVLR